MPRVTVIISTYNWATVLPYSIGSVLDQTFKDFELLVIGDGCTDESAQVVGAIDDPRVRWHNLAVNTKNQTGPNNEGLRLASGEVIAYLNHDDLWLPHHLQVLLHAVDEGAMWARASLLSVQPHGRPAVLPDALMVRPPAAPRRRIAEQGSFTSEMSNWVSTSSLVHVRQLAVDVGGWRSPNDTGACSPPTDLWNRMTALVGPPRLVRRITSVKIAAASRRGVYRGRPFHEQAYWLNRIRDSDDPEEEICRASEEDYVFAQPDWARALRDAHNPSGFATLARSVRDRLALRYVRDRHLRTRLTSSREPVSAAEYLRSVRRYKGLKD